MIPQYLFRAYDIRGNTEGDLTEEAVAKIGHAFGILLRSRGGTHVAVARDGRLSSERLQAALVQGLLAAGAFVLEIGCVPSPVLYFAADRFANGSGIIITGSHNPPQDNGLKLMLLGETLAGEMIQTLYHKTQGPLEHVPGGTVESLAVLPDYVSSVLPQISMQRSLRVVVDGGHGVAGPLLVMLLRALKCEVIPLYCEIDGHFPAHHPDPSRLENLQELKKVVRDSGSDLGLALDGDGDRLGVVDETGTVLWPDQVMMFLVEDLLKQYSGATIVYDVKCTQHLGAHIRAHGGIPLLCRTGHSFIKAKLKEKKAIFAGEMSGHLFFADTWNGFDDAAYAACRLVQSLAKRTATLSEWRKHLPVSFSTPELTVRLNEGEQFHIVEQFSQRADFPGATKITIDGLRLETEQGWALVRASNTTAQLVLRFEANTQHALEQLQSAVKKQLLAIKSDLCFSF